MATLTNKILDINDYKITSRDFTENFNLGDKVIVFFGGNKWRIIKLDHMLSYPVLYSIYNDEKERFHMTLVVCPITLRSFIYKGKVKIIELVDSKLKLQREENNEMFYLGEPKVHHYGNDEYIHIKRNEVRIMLLRNVFKFSTDPEFIIPLKSNDLIYPQEYYSNTKDIVGKQIENFYHPKTLVYVIQYYSAKNKKFKQNIIINKDISEKRITGFDYTVSGTWDFVAGESNILIERDAIIFPMLWFMAEKLYPLARRILLKPN